MTFATPALLLLVPLVIAALAWRFWRRPAPRPALLAVDLAHVVQATPSRGWRVRLRWLPSALRVIAVLLFVVAAARPQRGLAVSTAPEEGIDIVLALDMSGSMTQPVGKGPTTRLDAARSVVRDFVSTLHGDRVGLVIFQAKSLVMSPLTSDRTAIQRAVADVKSGLLPDGTAIGLGEAEALNLLRNSPARSRVLVLLTDGQNNTGEIQPLQAAQLTKTLDVRIYTIGFAPQAAGDLDHAVLQRIADDTGGNFYDASTQAELARAYQQIGALERSRVGEQKYTLYQELAPWLIAGALAVLVVEGIFRTAVLRRYP